MSELEPIGAEEFGELPDADLDSVSGGGKTFSPGTTSGSTETDWYETDSGGPAAVEEAT